MQLIIIADNLEGKNFLTIMRCDGIMVSIMTEVICPHCQNPIYDDDALLCHFCGESLHRAGKGFLSNLKYSNKNVIWFLLIGVLLLSFILIVIF